MPPVSYIETYCPSRQNREATLKGLPAYYRVTVQKSRGAWPGSVPGIVVAIIDV